MFEGFVGVGNLILANKQVFIWNSSGMDMNHYLNLCVTPNTIEGANARKTEGQQATATVTSEDVQSTIVPDFQAASGPFVSLENKEQTTANTWAFIPEETQQVESSIITKPGESPSSPIGNVCKSYEEQEEVPLVLRRKKETYVI